jgi:hypothetical protein
MPALFRRGCLIQNKVDRRAVLPWNRRSKKYDLLVYRPAGRGQDDAGAGLEKDLAARGCVTVHFKRIA